MNESMSSSEEILHVSDTALMVAACRAMETERADGLVRDPFARRLAGDRGMAIALGLPGWEFLNFGVAVRTRFLDDLVTQTIADQGIATVLSAGCGLDTRPWRLSLPARLHWIEVDFSGILDYKAAAMAHEEPRCRLQRIAADLNDPLQRKAAFASAGEGPGLLITEGLLMYLSASTVDALAVESVSLSGIRYWLLDAASMDLARQTGVDSRGAIQNVRAPGHLEGVQILEAVSRHGWTQMRHRSYSRDAREFAAERIQAAVQALAAAGKPLPTPSPDDPSGVYLFGRE
jgi:methyltransferase (TIGR00027 family)